MFTGIVEAVGSVQVLERSERGRRMRIEAPGLAPELANGDSVAVDGACLTVTRADSEGFEVDVIVPTLEKTLAGRYADGTPVNLERAARLGGRLDGHIVQGHVDGVGELVRRVKDGETWLLDVRVPPEVHRLTLQHGSIALNGVSLTVSELLSGSGVRIGVIPFTHAHTNLGDLQPGDALNVEGDMIGKYVARILAGRDR